MNHNERDDWIWSLRVWALILKSVLELDERDRDLDLARNSVKEIVNIIAEISYMYNLWNQPPIIGHEIVEDK